MGKTQTAQQEKAIREAQFIVDKNTNRHHWFVLIESCGDSYSFVVRLNEKDNQTELLNVVSLFYCLLELENQKECRGRQIHSFMILWPANNNYSGKLEHAYSRFKRDIEGLHTFAEKFKTEETYFNYRGFSKGES